MVQGPLQVRVFFPMKYKKITITIIYEVYPQNQGGNLYIKLLLISISQKITFSWCFQYEFQESRNMPFLFSQVDKRQN